MKRKTIYWLVAAISLLLLAIVALDVRLKTVYYTVKTDKVENELTIGLVADLHSCNYGENQRTLTEAIDQSRPDVLLLAGDIIDDEMPLQKSEEFLSWAGKHYPSYYVTGNHEYWTGQIDEVRDFVRSLGVTVLEGQNQLLTFRGQKIQICGINDREIGLEKWQKELKQCGDNLLPEAFSVLLTHRPEEISEYRKYPFDLITAGHAHGGQWRLPAVINGLYAPNQGLFPKYAGGRYDFEESTFIVSRGLARESTRIPRIFNRPEYVVIRLVPEHEK